MTDQHHPISPPPKLVEQWFDDSPMDRGLTLAIQAARWGANQELEACCEWLEQETPETYISALRDARRPPIIPAGYPSYKQIQRFMFEAGFDVPDPDQEPAFPRAKYMKLAARIVDWSLAQ
jgi:hypothetical protein